MARRRRGKRNRERKSKGTVATAEWWCGYSRLLVEITNRGDVWTSVRNPGRVKPADRERAADWLQQFLPRLTHDERYAILWGD